MEAIRDQTEVQVANFKRGMLVSLDACSAGTGGESNACTLAGGRHRSASNDVLS